MKGLSKNHLPQRCAGLLNSRIQNSAEGDACEVGEAVSPKGLGFFGSGFLSRT